VSFIVTRNNRNCMWSILLSEHFDACWTLSIKNFRLCC